MAKPASIDNSVYQAAADLGEQGKLEAGWKIIGKLLIDDPNDVRALVTGSYIMRRLGALPQAYHFAKSATAIWPHDSAAWTNLGHAASEMWLVDDAEECYHRALKTVTQEKHKLVLWLNLSALYLDNGRFREAQELTERILAIDPDHANAKANLGFCQLAQRNWEGWKGYHNTIGSDWRPKVQYGDEPEWDGTPGKVVALYGDQGLGDEISFASMLPDAERVCKKLILDCDERLEGLFKRSFPGVRVYGTRRAKEGQWAKEDRHVEASLPVGQIGEFFRTKDSDFPGTPYLVPCPDRVKMWKGLFGAKGKPVIGIAWRGGIPKTNARNRQLMLSDLLPVFRSVDAHFVSLQYKDATKEIDEFRAKHPDVDLVQYKFGTLTSDYDDTAALIASLDYVLCIQTAVAHTAGALGVPVSVLLPVATQWRYGDAHETIPWYNSLRVIRQSENGQWRNEIERAAKAICDHLGVVPSGAGKAARNNGLRDSIHRVCAAGVSDREQNGHIAHSGLRMRGEFQPRKEPKGRTQTQVSGV